MAEYEKEHVDYGKNGLNYNFGINITQGVLTKIGE